MDDLASLGMPITIGFVVLLFLIVVPLAVRSARKGQAAARGYAKGPGAKTGFATRGSRYEGNWQGFPAWLEPHFDFNFAGLASNLVWGKSLAGSVESMGRQNFFHRYEFHMTVPGGAFPPTAFYERDWWGIFGNVEWQRKKPAGEKLQDGIAGDAKVDVYGTDPAFAARLAADARLAPLLARWPYLNLQIAGDAITLELIHHWRELEGKFGREGLMGWDFAVTGLNLMAAAATAARAAATPAA